MTVKKITLFNAATWVFVAALFVLSAITQDHLYLNWDVNWLFKCSAKLLQGGHYYYDFCEINPPLIIYLYLPVILLAKMTGLGLHVSVIVYVLLLSLISLLLCRLYARQIFLKSTQINYYLFLLALVFVFLFLPANQFAQREHLLVIFIVPYLLSVYMRIIGIQADRKLLLISSIFAGLGFALKPHFLLTLLLVELYLLYKTRKLKNILRLEAIVIGMAFAVYLSMVFVFNHEYLYKMLPLVLNMYLHSLTYTFSVILTQAGVVYALFALLFYIILRKKMTNIKILADIFVLAVVGFLCAYFIQQAIWFYHLYPAVALACLLVSLLYRKSVVVIYSLCAILLIPLSITYDYTASAWLLKNRIPKMPLVQAINKYRAGGKVFIFSTSMSDNFFIIDQYANNSVIGRFPAFWMLPGVMKKTLADRKNVVELDALAVYKNLIINMVVEDLQKFRPKLIVVDMEKRKPYFNDIDFDYIKFFSNAEKFRQIFSHYRIVAKTQDFYLYELNINT